MALAARDVVCGHHPVADREAAHALAGLDHVADHLVTEHGGNARAGIGELGDVRAAQPAAAQPQQQLPGAGGRTRHVRRGQAPRALKDNGPHATRPSRPLIQQRSAMAALRRAGSATRSSKTRKRRASISPSSAK